MDKKLSTKEDGHLFFEVSELALKIFDRFASKTLNSNYFKAQIEYELGIIDDIEEIFQIMEDISLNKLNRNDYTSFESARSRIQNKIDSSSRLRELYEQTETLEENMITFFKETL